MAIREAMFGAGCFWGVEFRFSKLNGVIDAFSGYAGGDEEHFSTPTYKEVCSDGTGHAEVVHVNFDDDKISYGELIDVFWKNHNPTTMNCQGPDVGSQYRSVIFYYSEEQKKLAEETKEKEQKEWKEPIVTQIVPATTFHKAEEYHQKYLEKQGKTTC